MGLLGRRGGRRAPAPAIYAAGHSVEEFLARYHPSYARGPDGLDMLFKALNNGDLDARLAIVDRLLADGADPARKREDGLCVLHCLFQGYAHDFEREAPLLQRFLDAGADLNSRGGRHGETPLEVLGGNLKFSDTRLAPFYDLVFARPDLDLMTPSYGRRTTYENVRRMAKPPHDRRADLLERCQAYLDAHGQPIPEPQPPG